MTDQQSLDDIAALLARYPGVTSTRGFTSERDDIVHLRFRCNDFRSLKRIASCAVADLSPYAVKDCTGKVIRLNVNLNHGPLAKGNPKPVSTHQTGLATKALIGNINFLESANPNTAYKAQPLTHKTHPDGPGKATTWHHEDYAVGKNNNGVMTFLLVSSTANNGVLSHIGGMSDFKTLYNRNNPKNPIK